VLISERLSAPQLLLVLTASVNYGSCGRYHCKITGLGFLGLGILAILDTLRVINPAAWIIWTALFAVLALGFSLEYRYNSKSGSCYVACDSKG
jgi:hypothetical protein